MTPVCRRLQRNDAVIVWACGDGDRERGKAENAIFAGTEDYSDRLSRQAILFAILNQISDGFLSIQIDVHVIFFSNRLCQYHLLAQAICINELHFL
ncbi:hypothetical protein [Dickeya solani]|uniref:Uncharacterized protein n=1 Tax=Dickeya solani TaxID=1089444 RepID=A0ABU4EAJ4_9GAMM|nr:hypothetical protein [Dickeya solani]MCA6997665.1 hypothetical protein [Dickeya solani]MCZ0821231.1 hypothetical protein [Dickeya solani]MDV6993325.1 hypothetical protein [Dickeya solani]MDV7003597.1 hypothetical protein [Dickeya solani]MDV7036174.1 hypothetical protein [Dickeya solani]